MTTFTHLEATAQEKTTDCRGRWMFMFSTFSIFDGHFCQREKIKNIQTCHFSDMVSLRKFTFLDVMVNKNKSSLSIEKFCVTQVGPKTDKKTFRFILRFRFFSSLSPKFEIIVGHTAVAYEHKVYIFGGRNDEMAS